MKQCSEKLPTTSSSLSLIMDYEGSSSDESERESEITADDVALVEFLRELQIHVWPTQYADSFLDDRASPIQTVELATGKTVWPELKSKKFG